jgi:cystathionine gamma-synthase
MTSGMDDPFRFDTLAVHAGQDSGPNPLEAFETRLAALEGAGLPGGGAWALGLASGRASVDAIARLLRPGDRVVLSEELNPRSLEVLLPYTEFGVELEFRDLTDPSRWRFRNTSLVWLESPGSVNLGVVNLSSVSNRAHDAGALVVVDNSSATAMVTRPLEFGVDVVVYSSVGSLVGNASLKLGALLGRDEALRDRLIAQREILATRPDAAALVLAKLGLSSLSVRMERQSRVARDFAKKLLNQPGIRRVFYPGLESHRGHSIAAGQMCSRDGRGLFGPNFTLRLESPAMAEALPTLTRLWRDSSRVGGAQSSVAQPAAHVGGLGVPTDVVRFSVGLEDETDLWTDLERALAAVRELHPNAPVASRDPIPAASDPEAQPETIEAVQEAVTPEPTVPAEPDQPSGPSMTFEPATQDPTANLGGTELDRYARLREWRDAEAERLEISRFQVASNALLSGVARTNPDSLTELEQIKGIGPERVKRYGDSILTVLRGGTPTDSIDHLEDAIAEVSSPSEPEFSSSTEPEISSAPEASASLENTVDHAETPSSTHIENIVQDGVPESEPEVKPKRRGRPRKVVPAEPTS